MTTFDPEEGYELYAPNYKSDHAHLDSFDWEPARIWIQEAISLASAPLTLLDAGCGDGRTLTRCWKWSQRQNLEVSLEYYGVDISRAMLHRAAKRLPQARFDRLNLNDLQACGRWVLANKPAGLITAFFVLVHFSRIADFFAAMRTLSGADTNLIMNTIPQKSSPELSVNGHRFQIRAWHHETQDVVDAGHAQGWNLVRQNDIYEAKELISTLLWWKRI